MIKAFALRGLAELCWFAGSLFVKTGFGKACDLAAERMFERAIVLR